MASHNLILLRKLYLGFGNCYNVLPPLQATALMNTHDRCYLITHAHMDHINSLVLSAGSLDSARPRRIHAVTQTLKDIETVFSDRLWPNLASWEGESDAMLIYSRCVLVSVCL